MHYMRWWEHGDPLFVKFRQSPAGAPAAFLEAALAWQEDACLLWPFSKNNVGYAQINVGPGKKKKLVTRIICERANGAPSTDGHLATHSCGNGHLGCISPKHLRWGTYADNAADMVRHGRSTRGERSTSAKLTRDQALAVYQRANAGESQQRLSREFGITQTAVSRIKRGINWRWLTEVAA